MNNTFSFERIKALNKLYFTSERKMLITIGLVALGSILIFYIVPILFSLVAMGVPMLDTANAGSNSMPILAIIFVVAVSISMRPYFKRGGATAEILLPAKNSEKFLSIFFRTLVVNGVALVAMSILANILFCAIMGHNIDWSLWFPVTLKDWGGAITQTCFAHAIFMFGATIFKRNAFIYTVLCLLGFSLAVGILSSASLFLARPLGHFSIEIVDMIKIIARIFIISSTLAMWIFSWIRFKNITIA